MVSDPPGMKVLLLDKDTTGIISLVYAQSEILQKEVYLIERIDVANREPMTHLKCVAFLRPTTETIDGVVEELRHPKYSQYDLYFSNILSSSNLDRLAQADENEVVRNVQEFFADYYAVNHHVFSVNQSPVLASPTAWDKSVLQRTCQALASVMLSLKKRPAIRYAASSEPCHELAKELSYMMQQEAELFTFHQSLDVPPVLMILDRRDDPVTPLLNQWTYQAMVHELLGIINNRVTLPKAQKDMKEVVLTADSDEFYKGNMYKNFGEIGNSIRVLVDEFQKKTKSHEKIESIADMKAFVENYPQFKALSGTVSKHVTVIGELSKMVDSGDFLNISEAEQDVSCQSSHSDAVAKIRPLLSNPKVSPKNRIRLVMLYALRYEKSSNNCIQEFLEILMRNELPEEYRRLLNAVLDFAGADSPARQSDLYGTKGTVGLFKSMAGGLKGVDNIYTQHSPLLASMLDSIAKGKLKDSSYPFIRESVKDRPQDLFIFMVGGTTYEEAKIVAEFNAANPTMRVVLGGTTIHNFDSFCEEMTESLKKFRSAQRSPGTSRAAASSASGGGGGGAGAAGPRRPQTMR